jgi:hypothetical protein
MSVMSGALPTCPVTLAMAWPPRASVTVTVNEQWPLAGVADKVNVGVRKVASLKVPWQLRLHE